MCGLTPRSTPTRYGRRCKPGLRYFVLCSQPRLTAPTSAGGVTSNVRPHIHTTVRRQALRIHRSAATAMQRYGRATKSNYGVKPWAAVVQHIRRTRPNRSSQPVHAQPPVAVATRALTLHAPGQHAVHAIGRKPGKARSALPNSQSGAAAAEYGSRNRQLRASARSTASPWSSSRLQRGAGYARRVLGTSSTAGLPHVRPNPSVNADPLRQAA
jgi:hypothetical protein